MARPLSVAAFVSPHGFGHAARACAVMQALSELEPAARFEVYTLVPEWFFADSLACPFRYHALHTDVGLVQTTALTEDLDATLARLDDFVPFEAGLVDRLARELDGSGCRLVLADISPLGIAVARHARIPVALVENFTWDWIYSAYLATHPAFERAIGALAPLFESADLRVQTEPVCRPATRAATVAPVSRAPRAARARTRHRLGLAPGEPTVLVTMGGVPWEHRALSALAASGDAVFVVPGGSDRLERHGSLVALPHRSGIFHPDLVAAADAVVGKLGYSTLAEAYAAAVPFAYVPRARFRESGPLASFVAGRVGGFALDPVEFESGAWLDAVPALLALPPAAAARGNGAGAAARLLGDLLRSGTRAG